MHTLQPSQDLTATVAAKLKKMLNLSHTKKSSLSSGTATAFFVHLSILRSFPLCTVVVCRHSGKMAVKEKNRVWMAHWRTLNGHIATVIIHTIWEKSENNSDPREAIILFQANQPRSHCFHIPKFTSHSVYHACRNIYKIPIFTGTTSFFQCFNFFGLDAIPREMTKWKRE